jgi:hypothetical protein
MPASFKRDPQHWWGRAEEVRAVAELMYDVTSQAGDAQDSRMVANGWPSVLRRERLAHGQRASDRPLHRPYGGRGRVGRSQGRALAVGVCAHSRQWVGRTHGSTASYGAPGAFLVAELMPDVDLSSRILQP